MPTSHQDLQTCKLARHKMDRSQAHKACQQGQERWRQGPCRGLRRSLPLCELSFGLRNTQLSSLDIVRLLAVLIFSKVVLLLGGSSLCLEGRFVLTRALHGCLGLFKLRLGRKGLFVCLSCLLALISRESLCALKSALCSLHGLLLLANLGSGPVRFSAGRSLLSLQLLDLRLQLLVLLLHVSDF